MIRRPPRSTRTDTLFPYTTLFRSAASKASFVRILISVVVAVTGFLDVEFRQQHADDIGTALREALERVACVAGLVFRSEEHTSELQSLMRISYAVFCLKKKKHTI